MAMRLAVITGETEERISLDVYKNFPEYESIADLKKAMRSSDGFILDESYTLVERKPIFKFTATQSTVVKEEGTL